MRGEMDLFSVCRARLFMMAETQDSTKDFNIELVLFSRRNSYLGIWKCNVS